MRKSSYRRGLVEKIQIMSALFDFPSFVSVVLLTICTCTYIQLASKGTFFSQKTGCETE